MLDVHELSTSLPHIQTSKDFIRIIVLLISQKDYEHYIAMGFESKLYFLKICMLFDMSMSVGKKTPMGGLLRMDMAFSAERSVEGECC